jgi:hypothetical protein
MKHLKKFSDLNENTKGYGSDGRDKRLHRRLLL